MPSPATWPEPKVSSPPTVFAVEDTSVQLVWRALPPGEHTVELDGRTATVVGTGGPAAVAVDGLAVGTTYDVVVDGRVSASCRTLEPPPGRELFRFATVSDLHVGDGWTFGVLPTVRDPHGADDPPVIRAARAAVAELAAWGAQLVVAKGDLTHHGHAEEFELAAELLSEPGIPVVATRGNHDVRKDHVDGRPLLAAAGIELAAATIAVRDVPGLRIVAADSTMPLRHPGSFGAVRSQLLDALDVDGPAFVAAHHQFQRLPFPTHWPPGILGPESGRVLDAVAAANPATVLTSGHTHRHRARRVGPLLLTEVGSPKDHPGTWAGYVVHEGGIRQVVRRVMAPSAIRWTDDTRRALLGIWGRYSPGRLDDRCLVHRWPAKA